LNDELRKQGLSEMQFFLLKHGESRLIEIKEADKENEDKENEKTVSLEVPDMNGDGGDEAAPETTPEEAEKLQQLVDNLVDETEKEKSGSDLD